MQNIEIQFDYCWKYTTNSFIRITIDSDESIRLYSSFGELMLEHYNFVEVIKFLQDLHDGKYAE